MEVRGRRAVEEDIKADGTEGTADRVGVQYAGGAKMAVATSEGEKVEDERASGGANGASAAGTIFRWLLRHLLQHQKK